MYRFYDEAGSSSELENSAAVRTALNEVAMHEDAKQAVRELNSKYVLLQKRVRAMVLVFIAYAMAKCNGVALMGLTMKPLVSRLFLRKAICVIR